MPLADTIQVVTDHDGLTRVVVLPGPLSLALWAQARAEGLTVEQLVVTLLSVPLEQVARVRPLKCMTCGRPWIDHDAGCVRHAFRPEWARVLDRPGEG